jgi:hypothetical protein
MKPTSVQVTRENREKVETFDGTESLGWVGFYGRAQLIAIN